MLSATPATHVRFAAALQQLLMMMTAVLPPHAMETK
jgi:hypothetical protein